MSSYLDCTDHFCGMGGSTTGLLASGIEVVHAANHNALSIASHSENYPQIKHSIVDLSKADPRCFKRTALAWFSPECTTYSPAGGRRRLTPTPVDAKTVRSRLTMFDVVRFTEIHRYEAVFIEQVCEVAHWSTGNRPGDLFEWWLKGMEMLGYRHQIVCFNSAFAYPEPTPQSRDRLLIVFHKKGNKAPMVELCPPAVCPEHGHVNAVQQWKPQYKDRELRVGK